MLIYHRPNIQTYNRNTTACPKNTFGGEKIPEDWTRPLIEKARQETQENLRRINSLGLSHHPDKEKLIEKLNDETALLKDGMRDRLDEVNGDLRRLNRTPIYNSSLQSHSEELGKTQAEKARILAKFEELGGTAELRKEELTTQLEAVMRKRAGLLNAGYIDAATDNEISRLKDEQAKIEAELDELENQS